MTRQSFIEGRLGPWSSHPAFLATRARRWMQFSLLPIGAGAALYLLAWRFGLVSLSSLALDWERWLPLVLALLVLGCTFAVTAILTTRLSTCEGSGEPAGRPVRIKIWSFVLAALLFGVLAYVLSQAAFLSTILDLELVARIRWAGHLMGTVPLVVLFIYAMYAGRDLDSWGSDRGPRSRFMPLRKLLALLGIFVGCIAPMVWMAQISDLLQASMSLLAMQKLYPAFSGFQPVLPEIKRWLPGFSPSSLEEAIELVAALATALPLFSLGIFVYFLAHGLVPARAPLEQPVAPEEVAATEGFHIRPPGEAWLVNGEIEAERPRAARWRAVKPTVAQPVESAVDAPEDTASGETPVVSGPAWLGALVTRHPDWGWGVPRRVEVDETSQVASRPDMAHLFLVAGIEQGSSRAPTKDQIAALELFDRRFDALLRAEDREGLCVYPSADLLVSGPPGSGRSTLLIACAMHAVVLRGQGVLVLCPTPEKVRAHVRRLRDAASRSGVGWFVSVGELTRDDVLSWADDRPGDNTGQRPYLPARGSLPDILVGTPHDYERLMFGADIHHAPVRRALLRLQVVLVEEITSFEAREQRHLPFLLDKHRLLLGVEHLPVQFLVVVPRLSQHAAVALGERLYSERESVQCAWLRPWPTTPPWVVDVQGDDPEQLELVAKACVDAGLDVVVHRPGLAREACEQFQRDLSSGGGRAQVVADLDELGPDAFLEVDAAIHRGVANCPGSLALLSRLDGTDVAILRVSKSDALAYSQPPTTTLPVLPAAHSPALYVGHLQSLLRHLDPFAPAPRDLWAKLGLGADRALLAARRLDMNFSPLPHLHLVVDPPEDAATGKAAARNQEWSWVALHVESLEQGMAIPAPDPRPVEMFRPIDRQLELRLGPNLDRVLLGSSSHSGQESSVAHWSTSLKGESLDQMDLAYADNLRFLRTAVSGDVVTGAFVPESIRRMQGRDGDRIEIAGRPFRDAGMGEYYLPLWHARVHVPSGVRHEFGSSPTDSMCLVRLGGGGADDPTAQGRVALAADADEIGNLRWHHPPIDVVYESRVCCLVLRPAGALAKQPDGRLAGDWSTIPGARTVGQPWSMLGLALTSSLRRSLPSLFEYCRLVAFFGAESGAGESVVHFLEPVATQRTAYEALRTLLDDPYLTIEVLRHACDELETLQSDADGFALRMLRVRAGCEMGSSQLDSEEVLRQVQVGVTLLRSLVEDLEAKVGLSRRLSRANKRGRTHE
jgi:hypothetical protein